MWIFIIWIQTPLCFQLPQKMLINDLKQFSKSLGLSEIDAKPELYLEDNEMLMGKLKHNYLEQMN